MPSCGTEVLSSIGEPRLRWRRTRLICVGILARDVADKAIAHDDVDLAVVEVAAFDVADEVHREVAHELEGGARKLVAFAFFFAVAQQPDARPVFSEDAAKVDLAHHGELLEV